MARLQSRPVTRRPPSRRRAEPELPRSWTPANERRVQLLQKGRTRDGLSPAEEAELEQIKDLTRRYLDVVAPISFEVIEDLRQAVEQAEKRAGRSRVKAG